MSSVARRGYVMAAIEEPADLLREARSGVTLGDIGPELPNDTSTQGLDVAGASPSLA